MKLHIVNRPQFDEAGLFSFIKDQGISWRRTRKSSPAEELVELAGRVCYMSFGKAQSPRSNQDYIRNLITMGHESVLEHVSWTFILTGVSRAFTHQLVRHRVGFSFSQLSQQYHDERNAGMIEPAVLGLSMRARKAWLQATKSAAKAYKQILKALEDDADQLPKDLNKKELSRLVRSAARSVMPNATETKIVVTANARALRHFLSVRGTIPGDEEMRHISIKMLREFKKDAPALFIDFRIASLPDGTSIIIQGQP